MTRDDVLNMPTGREMDALIAEKVMGLVACDNWHLHRMTEFGGIYMTNFEPCKHEGKCYPKQQCPEYSNNISAAWQVVEKMNEKFSVRAIAYYQSDCLANIWDVKNFDKSFMARADTAPLAICRAALLAVLEVE